MPTLLAIECIHNMIPARHLNCGNPPSLPLSWPPAWTLGWPGQSATQLQCLQCVIMLTGNDGNGGRTMCGIIIIGNACTPQRYISNLFHISFITLPNGKGKYWHQITTTTLFAQSHKDFVSYIICCTWCPHVDKIVYLWCVRGSLHGTEEEGECAGKWQPRWYESSPLSICSMS